MPDPLLTARTLVLAKIEATYNIDPIPTPAADAYLVSEADIRIDPNILERNNFRSSISPTAIGIGRKIVTATFTHEVKGSGTIGTVAKLGVLLRACGFAETVIAATAAATISDVILNPNNVGVVDSWSDDVAATKNFDTYRVNVVTAGASTVAEVQVTSDGFFEEDATILRSLEYTAVTNSVSGTLAWNLSDLTAPVLDVAGTWVAGETFTILAGGVPINGVATDTTPTIVGDDIEAIFLADGRFTGTANVTGTITVSFSAAASEITITTATTAVALGASDADVTPTFAGSLTVGDWWEFDLLRPGVHYDPVSTAFESVTIHMFFDGLLHKVTGCFGTFSVSGEAGNFATVSFTFTGQYIVPTDTALPAGSLFESTQPQQVELAELTLDFFKQVCAQSFTIDMNNNVVVRDCISGADGFNGVNLTGRDPQGSINPETVLEATNPFWANFAAGALIKFHVQVGTVAGNIVHFGAKAAQYSGITYGDRNETRTYDIGLRFSSNRDDGDDEISIIFA